MGKRSDLPRIPKDKYASTYACVVPLLPHLEPGTVFAEPCAGNGALIDLLADAGHVCAWATDIAPEREDIGTLNALALPQIGARNIPVQKVITNPPWTRSILHPLIDALSHMLPCWFLFDADWPHTRQSAELIMRCSRIIPIGRIKWIPDSEHVGKDNCCWYEFLPGHTAGPLFTPRGAIPAHAMMGPDERRRAQLKAQGKVAPPGPLFFPRESHDGKEARPVPVVQPDDGQVHTEPAGATIADASDVGSLPDSEIVERVAGGEMLPAVQSHQRQHAGGGVGGVSGSVSGLLAKLRSGLRPVVHPRIEPGDLADGQ